MIKDHGKNYNDLEKLTGQLNSAIPSEMNGFNELHEAVISEGALTVKTKELIALGIAITVRRDGCINYHIKNSLNAGAGSPEILETIGVAILMGGDPALIYGCEALEALNQFIVLEKNGQQ